MTVARSALAATLAVALLGAAPLLRTALDSQYVLQRYALAIDAVPVPKNVVFTYTVSQVGPSNIEQRHTIFRSGPEVRDETLAVDGIALTRKIVRFSRRDDRYAVARLAPRAVAYQILFLRPVKEGSRFDYAYELTPLLHQPGASIDRMTIDAARFLPRVVHFQTIGLDAKGSGEVVYAPFGQYWMPVLATVDATINGKPARERITWGDYRFPEALPPSTFEPPKPLPPAPAP
ncbi:MAG: hypothetical protein JOZ01_05470 [Candidatus Eremiobacteraeota bacterium]|nr:hypothetical protein [Candidatus Eremiobacteraeota bacterium]